VVKNNDPKALASFLKCLSKLEDNVFLLYKTLVEKVEMPLAKSLLLTLATDSHKHSILLDGVGNGIAKVRVKERDCEKMLGEIWRVNNSVYREIAGKERIAQEELTQLAEKLAYLESALGEEYYIFVQMQTLELMTKEINELYNINLENLKDIFASIIRDEERHREILGTVRGLLAKREQNNKDTSPLIKYQHPDSWITPSSPKE
jgi:hypothetical protein